MDDPFGRIGDVSIFCYSISCPFVQRVVQDIDVISSLSTWVFVSHVLQSHWLTFCVLLFFQNKCHVSILDWCASFRMAVSIEFAGSIATCHLLTGGRRFVVPTSGPYIYSAFSLLPLTFLIISPVPYRPRSSSSLRLLVSSGISSSLPRFSP